MKNRKWIITAGAAVFLVVVIVLTINIRRITGRNGGSDIDNDTSLSATSEYHSSGERVTVDDKTSSDSETTETIIDTQVQTESTAGETDKQTAGTTQAQTSEPGTTTGGSGTVTQPVEDGNSSTLVQESFSFTSVRIDNLDYDYYSWFISNGYKNISSIEELSSYAASVLDSMSSTKAVKYIITENGLFDDIAADMNRYKNAADTSPTARNVYTRDSYLYNVLGMDYQTYYCNGVSLFMIRKIQDVVTNKDSHSVYAIYYYSYQTAEQTARVNQLVQNIVSGFKGTAYDKVKAAHDYLCSIARYDGTGTYAHTAYGALVEGSCVCEGYVKAYQLMLDAMGIQCNIVLSTTHAWNEVNIDGAWYFIDVTNDDVNSATCYFLLGQDVLKSLEGRYVDGFYLSAENIGDFGYLDGSNTGSHLLSQSTYNISTRGK